MHPAHPSTASVTRREAIAGFAALCALLSSRGAVHASEPTGRTPMTIACIIRYQIDPFQRGEFKQHADNLIPIIPRCGGHLVGYFLPYEGTNDIAWGIITFESLAAYEAYKVRLKTDAGFIADTAFMQAKRIILREERNFVELVDGTFNLASTLAGKG
jgi:NIPSNAP